MRVHTHMHFLYGPTYATRVGRAFRDIELEGKILELSRKCVCSHVTRAFANAYLYL